MATIAISEKDLDRVVRRHVVDAMRELFIDPDAKFVLTHETKVRLRRSVASKKTGRAIPASVLFQKYGLRYDA